MWITLNSKENEKARTVKKGALKSNGRKWKTAVKNKFPQFVSNKLRQRNTSTLK